MTLFRVSIPQSEIDRNPALRALFSNRQGRAINTNAIAIDADSQSDALQEIVRLTGIPAARLGVQTEADIGADAVTEGAAPFQAAQTAAGTTGGPSNVPINVGTGDPNEAGVPAPNLPAGFPGLPDSGNATGGGGNPLPVGSQEEREFLANQAFAAADAAAGGGSAINTGGGLPPAIDGASPGTELIDREALFPGGAFRSFLRSGGVRPGGIGGSVLAGQENAALNTFAVLNDLGLVPEGQSFTDFLGSGTLGTNRFANLTRGALNQGQLADDFDVFGPGGTFTDAAARLAQAVQRSRGGSPITAGIFTPSLSQVQSRAQDLGFAGQETNFLDFLRQQFRPQLTPTG